MKAHVLVVDVETYYDSSYSLGNPAYGDYFSYISAPEFQFFGAGVALGNEAPKWLSAQAAPAWLGAVLASGERFILVGHNLLFDALVLQHLGVPVEQCERLIDTQMLARYAAPGRSSSLRNAAHRYLRQHKGNELASFKGRRMEDIHPVDMEDLARYCVNDVRLTQGLLEALKKIPEAEARAMDLTLRLALEPALELDHELANELLEEERLEAEATFKRAGVSLSVLRSNTLLLKHLLDLGVNVPMKSSPTDASKLIPAFGKSDAGWAKLKEEHPEHKDLFIARERSKSRLTETRLQRFLKLGKVTGGRFPVLLRYGAAHTLRFGGAGGLNMQNLPRSGRMRHCLRAPKGMRVVVADLNAVECRVLAWLAGAKKLMDVFQAGDNPYIDFASRYYGRPIDKATDQREYHFGKAVVLGLGYGMSAARLSLQAKDIGAGPREAHKARALYHRLYAEIPAFWKQLESDIAELTFQGNEGDKVGPHHKYLHAARVYKSQDSDRTPAFRLPSRRMVEYPDLRWEGGELCFTDRRDHRQRTRRLWGGMIAENVTQAVARDLLVESMAYIDRTIDRDQARLVLHAHDELVYVAPESYADELLQVVVEVMGTAPGWAPGLSLKAEGQVMERYGK